MTDEAANALIWAIVERACTDYMFYKRKSLIYRRNTGYAREYSSTVRFFKSDWWDCLMPNVDGQKVMDKLDEIVSKGETEDVCEQQLRESLEDISKREERTEVYGGSTVNQPQGQENKFLFNGFF